MDEKRVVMAQLSMSGAALGRLLSVSGSQSDFVLASLDGSTTVKVGLAIPSVPDGEITIGERGVVLDWSRSTLAMGARRVTLTRTELRLFVALLDRAPETATREYLIERVWPAAKRNRETDAALPVWIFALRRRLVALGLRDAVRTVRGAGYSLSV